MRGTAGGLTKGMGHAPFLPGVADQWNNDGHPLQADLGQAGGIGLGSRSYDFNAQSLTNIGAGSVSAPSIYFGSDTTTGFFRSAANQIGITVNGSSAGIIITSTTVASSVRPSITGVGSLSINGQNTTQTANTSWTTVNILGSDNFDTSTVTSASWIGLSMNPNVRASNSATLTAATGMSFSPNVNNLAGGTGTITTFYCIDINPTLAATNTLNITDTYGLRIRMSPSSLLGSPTITNHTGIAIDTPTNSTGSGITTAYGLRIPTTWSTNLGSVGTIYGVAVDSTAANYMAGALTVGTTGVAHTGVKVDISGGLLASRKTTMSLSNGANNNITLPTSSVVTITGPSGAFSLSGITGGVDGAVLILINLIAQNFTITNEGASSTAANRITTMTGADVVSTAACAYVLVYDTGTSRWILVSQNL